MSSSVSVVRSRSATCLLAEDMQDRVFAPLTGPLKREGMALGLRDVSQVAEAFPEELARFEGDNAAQKLDTIGHASRRQMPWVRLWTESEREWNNLQIPSSSARILTSRDWGVAPIYFSPTFWSSWNSDVLPADAALLGEILCHCWDGYDAVPWSSPRPEAIANRKVQLCSFSDFFQTSRRFRELKEADPNLHARAPDRAYVRADVVQRYGFGDDDDEDNADEAAEAATQSFTRPSEEWMLTLWRTLVLPTVTVEIMSEKEVKVALSLASVLATPSVNWREKTDHTGARSEYNPAHLLRFLILAIKDKYETGSE